MNLLHKFLATHTRIAIDTNIFVYLLEASDRYGELAKALFAWVRQSGNSAVASTIILTELLVPLYKEEGTLADFSSGKLTNLNDAPYRRSGYVKAHEFRILLEHYPNLDWIDVSLGIADLASQYRARYGSGFKTPDALHAATAVHAGATGFVTNDRIFDRLEELEVLQFEKLL